MSEDTWRTGFHLMPPVGWGNDPNGLCQFRGVYHVFHQYSPDWPAKGAERGWGHFTSTDLVRWEHHGYVIGQDTPADASGAYSGCALVVPGAAADGGDLLRLYYTGNVKEPGEHDFVTEGRRANQILIESEDGFALGEKRVLLTNDDYPADCSCHVRDPKLWRQDGALWMLLGARDLADEGLALVLRSEDGIAWDAARELRSDAPFGFMWECPDRVELDGHEYLAFCPQGMEERPWANRLRDQSGYVPLAEGERLIDSPTVCAADFVRWDCGFDFYAPQTFVDDAGRTILIGWMGLPEPPFESAPYGMDWIHCYTVPRVLTRAADGRIAQNPVPELEALRAEKVAFEGGRAHVAGRRADLVLPAVEGSFALTLGDELTVACKGGVLVLAFAEGAHAGAGRGARRVTVGDVRDLRVLVDDSAVEVYANGGSVVMGTRWFPAERDLDLALSGAAGPCDLWTMGDGMAKTYDR